MKITIESTEPGSKRQASVTVDSDDLTFDELMEQAVEPLLIAWGYARETVSPHE